MTLCKYFLQGNCRFGENCRFEHQINDGRYRHTSILRQLPPGNVSAAPPSTNQQNNQAVTTMNVAIRTVSQDATVAEKGGQWILSSYCPFKEKPRFPGFQNLSFEEIRYEFYQAQKNGTVDRYKYWIRSAIQDATNKLRLLQNPTPEVIEVIKRLNASTTQQQTTCSAVPFASAAFDQQQQQHLPIPNTFPVAATHPAQQFGAAPGNVFGTMPQERLETNRGQDPTAYSRSDDLTQEEIARFQADRFEFGTIPEKPPTAEMCT